MDEELSELAKEHDLTVHEIEDIRDLAEELGVDAEEAYDIWEAQ